MGLTQQELVDRTKLANEFLMNQLGHRRAARREGQVEHEVLCAAHQQALSAVVSLQGRVQGKHFDPKITY